MKLLAIDTSTEACSAALLVEGEILDRFELAPRRHAELILPMVDQLLVDADIGIADLDGLAYGRGPGTFTGLRIAAGVVQGIAFGADLPVAAVSSLAALSYGTGSCPGRKRLIAAIDARIGEVYWGLYEQDTPDSVQPVIDECVCTPDTVPLPQMGTWFGVGTGWRVHAEVLTARLGTRLEGFHAERYPAARHVALLGLDAFKQGRTISAEQVLPVYLRDQVVMGG